MVEQRKQLATFVAALDASFLPLSEKTELRKVAEKGVTPELWHHLNDRLIDVIVERQRAQKESVRGLDAEIDRFTKQYEEEKTRLDYALRDKLEVLSADDTKARESLWVEYRKRITRLQHRLLREVDKTSSTVLHDVVLATVREE